MFAVGRRRDFSLWFSEDDNMSKWIFHPQSVTPSIFHHWKKLWLIVRNAERLQTAVVLNSDLVCLR